MLPVFGSEPRPVSRSSHLTCLWLLLALFLLALLNAAPVAGADPGESNPFATALLLKNNGYYEDAVATLTALLASDNSSRYEVATALAETYEALLDWANADDTWQQAALASSSKQELAVAIFRRANALQQTGAVVRAAAFYRVFLMLQPHSYAREEALLRTAACYATAEDWPSAALFYRQALAGAASSEQRLDVLLHLAEALVLSGDSQGALALFEQEAASVSSKEAPAYQYRWALAERAAGKEEAGLERLRSVFLTYPRSPFAHAALIALLDAGQPVDEYLRGLVDYYAKAYEPAVAAFQRYIEADPEGHRGSAHYYAGLSYSKMDQYAAAISEFDWLINTHPGDPLIPAAWLAKGEALARSGDGEAAVVAYQTLANSYPQHELAPEALLRAGLALELLGSADEAITTYCRIYESYPSAKQAAEAGLRAGLVHYRASHWPEAEQAFRNALSLCGECENANRYRFWLGRALLTQGKGDEGTSLLQAVAGATPADYYSYRALVFLSGNDVLLEPATDNILLANAADQAEAEAWLHQTFDSTWQPGQIPVTVAEDARFLAAQEYLRLGLRQMAIDSALALSRDQVHSPIVQYTLALWLREAGLYRPSIQCAANIIYTNGSTRTIPRFIWSLVYPTYYSDLVLAEASASGLDPLLFFALMRQESLFDTVIGSSAGAQGLAQVMPATGEWIATQLGDSDFSPQDLLRPYISIRYGVWYLSQQFAYLGGNPLAALAGYNAGPGNALQWLQIAGSDPDLFYETIAFSETRRYLAAILPNYYYYCQLYASGPTRQ